MIADSFYRERLACAYFFVAPALLYGIFTSRLPALKALINATDAQIGTLLLALGITTLIGLLSASLVIDRVGSRKLLSISTCLMFLAMSCAAFGVSYLATTVFCLIAGLGVGFCDVAMNAQGIDLEKKHGRLCLSFLHACSGIGGVIGALSASLFAAFNISPALNMIVILGLFLLLMPLSLARMMQTPPVARTQASWKGIGSFVWICGILSLVCHIAEGSAGEWGSILLHTVKNATQQEAALAFAAFTGAMVGSRLAADRLRTLLSDFQILLWGSLLGAGGMALVLLSPWPALCLIGYATMGGGIAPIVPILFSRAGQTPSVTSGQASGIVSVLSYAGMLLIPPFLGILSQSWGLAPTLWIIVGLCLLLVPASFLFRK